MMNRRRFFLCRLMQGLAALGLCAILLLPHMARAELVVISPRDHMLNLDTLFQHQADPDHALTADALIASADEEWDRSGVQSHGYSRTVHWYRLFLLRPGQAPENWILQLGHPYVDDIRVYMAESGKPMTETLLGDHVPASRRPLLSRLASVPLNLPADRPVTLLIRVETTSASTITASLWLPGDFSTRQGLDGVLYGIYYGALLLVVLFHASIGMWIGDRLHIFYAGYVATQLVSYLCINGYGQLLLPDSYAWASDTVVNFGNFGGAILGLCLWMSILQISTSFPRLKVVYQIAMGLYVLMLTFGLGRLYTVLAPMSFLLGMLIFALNLILAGVMLWRNPRQMQLWFYLFAFGAVNGALIIHYLSLSGRLPSHLLPENVFQTGSVIHIIMLSVGLFYRVRQLERDRAQARQETLSTLLRANGQKSLVAMLSHEFRTPLATIHSAAQMIRFREDSMTEASLDRLERIEGTSRRLAALIDVFLASDALDQGKIVLNPRATEIGELVEDVLGQLGDQRLRITVSPLPSARLTADRDLLAVALRNCLANALTYTPDNNPIYLDIVQDQDVISFAIEDDGPGMEAEDLENLGTPYFRGRTGHGTSGSGLGISMVRSIVTAHGGAMVVESAPGAGTKITLSFKM